jgi:hypothetical protein
MCWTGPKAARQGLEARPRLSSDELRSRRSSVRHEAGAVAVLIYKFKCCAEGLWEQPRPGAQRFVRMFTTRSRRGTAFAAAVLCDLIMGRSPGRVAGCGGGTSRRGPGAGVAMGPAQSASDAVQGLVEQHVKPFGLGNGEWDQAGVIGRLLHLIVPLPSWTRPGTPLTHRPAAADARTIELAGQTRSSGPGLMRSGSGLR